MIRFQYILSVFSAYTVDNRIYITNLEKVIIVMETSLAVNKSDENRNKKNASHEADGKKKMCL